MSASTQAVKFKFGRNKFSKRVERILYNKTLLCKNLRDQVYKITDQLYVSKSIFRESYNLR